jgi:capsular exopolysaccharide synthesis family protein
MLQTIPEKEKELLEISRQQGIKNGIYTFLLQKREETALAYASEVADSRLVDAAESYGPVSPKKPLTYLISLVAALALGVLFISLKEVVNRNILFSTEIEKFTTAPILGEIAFEPSKKQLVIGDGKRTFVAEQLRQLRTSLGYLGINSRKKKILVTSTISGEGKSFISANLGVSLALMGKKVVLVELDLRKPKLSRMFEVDHSSGLTNYFIGDKEPEQIIRQTAYNENLFVIPSGPVPPNPSELILNGRLQELFAYLEDHFDYVIADTSPISPVTDAYIISPMCDATLYIVRHGVTPRSYIKRLDEHLRTKPLNNMAIVFNGVKGRGFGKYGYGYGYGNGYGYGYLEDGKKKRRGKQKV